MRGGEASCIWEVGARLVAVSSIWGLARALWVVWRLAPWPQCDTEAGVCEGGTGFTAAPHQPPPLMLHPQRSPLP